MLTGLPNCYVIIWKSPQSCNSSNAGRKHGPYFDSLQKCNPNFLLHRTSSLLFDMYTIHTNFKLWWSQTFTTKIQISFCHCNIPICLLGLHINLFFWWHGCFTKTRTSNDDVKSTYCNPKPDSNNGKPEWQSNYLTNRIMCAQ